MKEKEKENIRYKIASKLAYKIYAVRQRILNQPVPP